MTKINAQINPSQRIVAKHVTMHNVSKATVGLENVDNTSDDNKPISVLSQAALDLKANQSTTYSKAEVDANINNLVAGAPGQLDTLNELAAALGDDQNYASTISGQISSLQSLKADQTSLNTHIADSTNPHDVNQSQVGLDKVDNTTDAEKPVSSAQQTALDLKAPIDSPQFTGNSILFQSATFDDITEFRKKVKISPVKGLGLHLSSSASNNQAVSARVEGPVTVGHDLFQRSGFTGGFADGSNHFHSLIDINRIEQEAEGDVKNTKRVQERYYAVQGNFLPNNKAVFWAQHRVARTIATELIDTSTATLDVSLLQNSTNRNADNQAFFVSNSTPLNKSEKIEIKASVSGGTLTYISIDNQIRMTFSQSFSGPIVAASLFGKVTAVGESNDVKTVEVELYGGNYKTTVEVPLGTDQTALTFDEVELEKIGINTIVQSGNETNLQLYSKTNFTPERLKDETLKATWSVAHGLVKNEHCTLITDGRGSLVVKQSAYVLDPDPDSDGLSVILVYGRRIKQFDLNSFTAFGSSNWTLHKGTVDGIHDDTLGDNLINFNANNHGEYTAYQIGPGSQTDADCISIGKNVYNKDASTIKIGYDNAMLDVRSDGIVVAGDLTVDTDTLKVDAANDRVGINVESPTEALDVSGNALVDGDLTVDTNTLKVDSTNHLVGIGTTSPNATLAVRHGNAATPTATLEVRHDNDNGYVFVNVVNDGTNGGASLLFSGTSNNFSSGSTNNALISSNFVQKTFNIKNSMPDGTLELQTENSSGIANDGLIIDGDSNVSIPNGDLTVNTNTLKVDTSSGNVGIGATSPSERLEVREDIDNDFVRLKLDNQGANGGASIFFNEGATTHASIFATYGTGHKSFNIKNGMSNGTLELQTTNSSGATNDGLIIDGDSNVSIPNGDLTVDTDTLKVDSANNRVGIGTTTPGAGSILSVVGNSNFNGTIKLPTANRSFTKQRCYNKTGGIRLQKATSDADEIIMRYEGVNSNNFVIEQYKDHDSSLANQATTHGRKGQIKFVGGENILRLTAGSRVELGVARTIGNLDIGVPTTNSSEMLKLTFKDSRTQAHGLHFEHSGNNKVIQMGMYDSYPSATEGDFKITGKSGSNSVQDVLTIDQSSNAITLHQNTAIAGNVGIGTASPSEKLEVSGNALIAGDLTVNGTTTTVNTTNLDVSDNIILLNSGMTGNNAKDIGVILERGTTGDNAAIVWDESTDKFKFGTTTNAGTGDTASIDTTLGGIEAASLYLEGSLNAMAITSQESITGARLAINGTTLNVDDSDSSVGIGIAAGSDYKLNVAGDANVSLKLTTNTLEAITADISESITADGLNIRNNTLNVDQNEGGVGIGIASDTSGNAGAPILKVSGNVEMLNGDLTVDTDTLKVDSTNHLVGIGTATPTEALDVSGNIKSSGDITASTLTLSGSTADSETVLSLGQLVNSPTTPLYEFITNDTGTGSSAGGGGDSLTIQCNRYQAKNSFTRQSPAGLVEYARIEVNAGLHGSLTLSKQEDTNSSTMTDFLHLSSDQDSYLLTTGNFGIGTNTPSEKLEVSGNAIISGDLTVNGTTTTVNQTNLDVSDNIIGLNRGAATNANDSGLIIERGSTGDNAAIIWDESQEYFILGTTASTPAATGAVVVDTGSLYATIAKAAQPNITSVGNHFTVASAGYNDATKLIGAKLITDSAGGSYDHPYLDLRRWTGVNTDHRVASIELSPESADQNAIVFKSDTKSTNAKATTERMRIDKNGNVGIGTTSPDINQIPFLEKALIVQAGDSSSTTLQQAGIVIAGSSDSDDADDFGTLSFVNNHSTLAYNRVANIVVQKNGTDVNTSEISFSTADGSALNEALRIKNTGRVGIGTTSPSEKLEVSGNAIISGDLTVNGKVIDTSNKEFVFEVHDESNISGNKWYKIASVNNGNGGLHIRGFIANHVESFASQKLDIAINGRESNDRSAIEIIGTVDVLHNDETGANKAGIRIIKAEDGADLYDRYDVYVRTCKYNHLRLQLTKSGNTGVFTSPTPVTIEPQPIATDPITEIDTSSFLPGIHTITDSQVRQVIKEDGNVEMLNGDLTVDTDTLKVDSTNHRVGIGTTSPAYPLHVDQTTNGAPGITLQGADPTLYLYDDTNPTNSMKLAYNGSSNAGLEFRVFNNTTNLNTLTAMAIDTLGNLNVSSGINVGGGKLTANSTGVGIGTTSPVHALHIEDVESGDSTVRAMVQRTDSGQVSFDLKNTVAGFRLIADDTGSLRIFDDIRGADRFTIDSSGNIRITGDVINLYNKEVAASTESGDASNYYHDSYSGTRNLGGYIKNSRSDLIRYRDIDNYEYWNGSAWVADSSRIDEVKKLLDGRQDTTYNVPARDYKFRFTVTPTTSYPTTTKVAMQTTWIGSSYPGSKMIVEEYDGTSSSWETRVTAKFGGANTPLETTDNNCDNWGLSFLSTDRLHTGKGNTSQGTRITVDFYGWTPSNASYVTIPLQNLHITSNYSGGDNTDYSNLLDYDRNLKSHGTITPGIYADTSARDTAIPSPTAGMMVFITSGTKFQGYTGSAWVDFN